MNEWKLADNLITIGKRDYDAYALTDAFEVLRALDEREKIVVEDRNAKESRVFENDAILRIHAKSAAVREVAREILASTMGNTGKLLELDKRSLLFDAPHDFDAFCQYMEINREDERQFYFPRRPQLSQIAKHLERLERGELELLGVSMPPGTGKSELALFFLTWIGGRSPDLANLAVSHSHSIIKLMHSELRRLLSPKDEYTWGEIFPVRRCGMDAELLTLDLGRNKRFSTYQFTSLGTSNAGRFRAQNYLYADDLVSGIEMAMNEDQMEKLWRGYTVDAKQRKIGDRCKELHLSTRWSQRDCVGRLESLNRNNPKALFLNYPVMDAEGHSLFWYPYGLGYDDAAIKELQDSMEDVFFSALYMGEPYEKDGQLYPKDELRRYLRLPDREPDGIIAYCDTKTTGTDYCALPIAYIYGSDYYIDDVVFENYSPEVVENSVVAKLFNHKVQKAQFESNVAGGKMAQVVQERLDSMGGITSITTKWTQAHKETKIQMNAPWVKQHCLFRDDSIIQGKQWSEYRLFLRQMSSYSLRGKNKHDDAVDVLAQMAVGETKASSIQKVKLGRRWF